MKKDRSIWQALCLFLFAGMPLLFARADGEAPLRVGWVGPLSGATTKYGAKEAALLAVDEINEAGGINGRRFELVMEDGRCDSAAAANAAMKLMDVEGLRIIIGAHCSRETLAMAPFAEKNKAVLLAAISSAPQLTDAGDYIFRATPLTINESPLLLQYLQSKGVKRLALVGEETEYCMATTDRLSELFNQTGGTVLAKKTYRTGDTDFRSLLTGIRMLKPDAIYLSAQSSDNAELLMREIRNQKITGLIIGNATVGNAIHSPGADPSLYEGVVYAEPFFDRGAPAAKAFITRYKEQHGGEDIPSGIWTVEAYDVVKLLGKILMQCGENPNNVKQCLYGVKNYEGASGRISIDEHGDGVREFALQTIRKGEHERISMP